MRANAQDSLHASSAAPLKVVPAVDPRAGIETFRVDRDGAVIRSVRRLDGRVSSSVVATRVPGLVAGALSSADADRLLLRSTAWPPSARGRPVRCLDLFSGCGGFSLGAREAARALGRPFHPIAIDFDPRATEVYSSNFGGDAAMCGDVLSVLDRAPGAKMSTAETRFARRVGTLDLLIGGPPCQGHSALNYRTRHRDERNELYEVMVRAAEILGPEHVVIENVPGALRDRRGVVQRSAEGLKKLGFSVSYAVVDASKVGVPQTRRRLLLLASKSKSVSADSLSSLYEVPTRTARWAIEDLADRRSSLLDEPAVSAEDTRRRIAYLFDKGLYDLPNDQRPRCHQGDHSYVSIYGRMNWDLPAQTLTRGFYSMCMGRYVHPARRRTITAHEAARLQFFPDFFDFSRAGKRNDLALMIGNAVPPKLSYISVLELLR